MSKLKLLRRSTQSIEDGYSPNPSVGISAPVLSFTDFEAGMSFQDSCCSGGGWVSSRLGIDCLGTMKEIIQRLYIYCRSWRAGAGRRTSGGGSRCYDSGE